MSFRGQATRGNYRTRGAGRGRVLPAHYGMNLRKGSQGGQRHSYGKSILGISHGNFANFQFMATPATLTAEPFEWGSEPMTDTWLPYEETPSASRNSGNTNHGLHRDNQNRGRNGATNKRSRNAALIAVAQGPVTLSLPEPLSDVQRHMVEAVFPKQERMDMLYAAIKGVNRRLKGHMPEDQPMLLVLCMKYGQVPK